MKKLLIRNATIVNEGKVFTGSVLIEGEIIREIIRAESSSSFSRATEDRGMGEGEVRDARGKLLIPGVIDDQVHFREPGLTHKGDIYSESRAAVAGGITSFMEMPNTMPQTITSEALKQKQEIAAKNSLCNYSFYFGATNDNIEEIKAIDPKTVCGIKVFMGASTGNMLVDKEESLRAIFKHAPAIVACHCEDEGTIRSNLKAYTEEYGEDIPFEYHPLIRSREACYKSSSLAVDLAMKYGTRLHILHISTEDEMDLFDGEMPLDQKRITAEVCVHHLWFSEKDYKEKGSLIKWNPAIKKESDRRALIDALKDGSIDIIASDHAPHTMAEKNNIYTKAPSGGPLVQHTLLAMLELWHRKEIDIETIVEKMCHNPAILFEIEGRGFIREGYKADLCLIDPAGTTRVDKSNILYKCGWSPFEGTAFNTVIDTTIVNGNIVYSRGKIANETPGELLRFKR